MIMRRLKQFMQSAYPCRKAMLEILKGNEKKIHSKYGIKYANQTWDGVEEVKLLVRNLLKM